MNYHMNAMQRTPLLFYSAIIPCNPPTNLAAISFSLASSGCGGEESRCVKVEPWACMSVPFATGPLVRECEGEEEVGGGGGGVDDWKEEGICNGSKEKSRY